MTREEVWKVSRTRIQIIRNNRRKKARDYRRGAVPKLSDAELVKKVLGKGGKVEKVVNYAKSERRG